MKLLRLVTALILAGLGFTSFGSVSSQTARIAYTAAALPAACPTTFPFNSTATVPDLIVYDGGPTNTGNSPPVTLTLNSDYTVTGGGYNSANQLQTGTVTILAGGAHNVQAGDVITILRNVPFTQTTTFSSSGFMSPLMIEAGLDKLTLQTQQLKDLFGLSLQFQKNETLSSQLVLSSRENLLLGFDSAGVIAYSNGGGGGGGGTYFAGTGLSLTGNTFSVNTTQPQVVQVGTLVGLDVSGDLNSSSTTDSSSSTTGAINTTGGLGVAKKLYVGTNLAVAGTSTLTGQVAIGTTINPSTGVYINHTITAASGLANGLGTYSTTTASANSDVLSAFSAQANFAKSSFNNLFAVSCNIPAAGVTGSGTIANAYGLLIGNVTAGTNNYAIRTGSGTVTFNDATDASSTSTGAVRTTGGVGIAKQLWVGTDANVAGTSTLTGNVGIGEAPLTTSSLTVAHTYGGATASAEVVVNGSLVPPGATQGFPNAFRDVTIYTPNTAGDAYASYDCNVNLAGTVPLNHYYGYQMRDVYTGTNTLDVMAGFTMAATVNSAGGTVTEMRGFYVPDQTVSSGTVTHYAGLFIDQLTAGTTRHAIYCAGNDNVFMAGGQFGNSALLTYPAGATTCRGYFTFDQASQTGLAVMNSSATATGTFMSFCNSGGTVQGTITQTNSTTTAYNTSSDRRLKEHFRPMTDSGAIIDSIQPVIFDWKWGGKDFHGVVAQDLAKVYPEAVTKTDDGKGRITGTPWQVDYSKLVPLLVEQIKELRQRVSQLEAQQKTH